MLAKLTLYLQILNIATNLLKNVQQFKKYHTIKIGNQKT